MPGGAGYRDARATYSTSSLAVLGYYQSTGSFPSGPIPNASLPPADRLSWYVPVSPYFQESELYNSINQTQPWNGGGNGRFAGNEISYLICPNCTRVAPPAPQPTTAIGIAGLGTDSLHCCRRPTDEPACSATTARQPRRHAGRRHRPYDDARRMGPSHRVLAAGGPATVRGLDPTNASVSVPADSLAVCMTASPSSRWPTARSAS